MAPPGVEFGKGFGSLAELAPAQRQLLGGKNLDRQFAAVADQIVLRHGPLAGLQPSGDLDLEKPIAF